MDVRTKELIAIGASITANCKSCLECAQDIIDCECYKSQADRIANKNSHWWEEEAFTNSNVIGMKRGLRQIEM